MFFDLFNPLIHIYCFMLFMRILFKESSEFYFHPVMRFIFRATDPVLMFLKKNKIARTMIHPLLAIMFFLLIKSLLIQTSGAKQLSLGNIFITSLIQFTSFTFKFYLFSFWMVFSSISFRIYDDIINLIQMIIDQTVQKFRIFRKNLSSSSNMGLTFLSLLIIFFIVYVLLIVSLLLLNKESLMKPVFIFVMPIKYLFQNFISCASLLPMLMFIRILLSWFAPPRTTPLMLLLCATEPILAPFRRLNLSIGMFDFSPIIAFFCLKIVIQALKQVDRMIF